MMALPDGSRVQPRARPISTGADMSEDAAPLASFVLTSKDKAAELVAFLKDRAGDCAKAGRPLVVIVTQGARAGTQAQRNAFHRICGEMAKHAWVHGEQYGPVQWKELLMRWFDRTEDLKLPDGTMLQQRRSLNDLNVDDLTTLIDRSLQFAAEQFDLHISIERATQ